jgi:dipeptidyl aminopeptidase/acylaminoacyl peptidase
MRSHHLHLPGITRGTLATLIARRVMGVRRGSFAVVCAGVALGATASSPQAAFQGANGRLAFVRDRDVYTSRADGTDERQISAGGFNRTPAWSPDGRRLLYVSSALGSYDLVVVAAAGGEPARVTNDANLEIDPAWSPDGRRIVFGRVPPSGGVSELFAMNLDGTAVANLGSGIFPAWSPDGGRIAFTGDDPSGRSQIYVMNADGSARGRLTTGTGLAYGPAWSPDGKRIAFVSSREGSLEIYSMNADGSDQRRLTSGARSNCNGPCEIGPFTPSWSPDGTRIAYASDRDGDRDLFVMNADGSGSTKVASQTGTQEFEVDWQPAADLRVQGKASRGRVGRPLKVTFTVRNQSVLASEGVRLRISLPRTATLLTTTAAGASCSRARAPVCELGSVVGGGSVAVTVVLRPRVASPLVVTATATSTSPEATTSNNIARLRVVVRRR